MALLHTEHNCSCLNASSIPFDPRPLASDNSVDLLTDLSLAAEVSDQRWRIMFLDLCAWVYEFFLRPLH
jgi:hypothetical protein